MEKSMMTPPPRPAPVTLYVDGAQVEAVAVLPGNVCPLCGAQVEASGRIMHIVGGMDCVKEKTE